MRFELQQGKQAIGNEPEARARIRLVGKKGIAAQPHSARFSLAHANAQKRPRSLQETGAFQEESKYFLLEVLYATFEQRLVQIAGNVLVQAVAGTLGMTHLA